MEQLQDLIPIQYLIVAAVVLAVLLVITLLFRAIAPEGAADCFFFELVFDMMTSTQVVLATIGECTRDM